jgi:hypothetical protein
MMEELSGCLLLIILTILIILFPLQAIAGLLCLIVALLAANLVSYLDRRRL